MRLRQILLGVALSGCIVAYGQTVDVSALKQFEPSVVKATYDICAMTPVAVSQQVDLARAIQNENMQALELLDANGGFLSNKDKIKLGQMRDDALAAILSPDQLAQYYRGVYNAEAQAEGVKMRDHVASQMSIGYQDGKFINFCFYKIGLEKRVIAKLMKATPAKAKEATDKMMREQLAVLESKSGLRITPDGRCERVRSVAIQ